MKYCTINKIFQLNIRYLMETLFTPPFVGMHFCFVYASDSLAWITRNYEGNIDVEKETRCSSQFGSLMTANFFSKLN